MLPKGWSEHCFGDVVDIASGQVDPKESPYSSMRHVGPEDIESDTGRIVGGDKTCAELGLISGKYEFDEKAVVYSKIRPHLNKVCRPGFRGVCSADAYPIWPHAHHLSGDYLAQYMLSPIFVKKAVACSMRTGMPKINRDDLQCIGIRLPPLDEQHGIVPILKMWDEAIAVTERLLKNSRKQKQALLSIVLTGKRRLDCFRSELARIPTPHGSIPDDWQYPRIGSIADEISQKHSGGQDYPVLSCTKHDGLVDSLSYFKKQVFSKDLSTYKVVPNGCFVYATNHIEEGSIGYQDLYDFGLVSPMYTVFKTAAEVHDSYLYRLLKTEHFRQIFAAATNSSVDRRGSLRWNDFKKLRVPLPPMEEQLAIAELFDQADREIWVLEKKVASFRDEKNALMQQLLTGKRRVLLPEPAKAVSA